jgi:hypothetical protein
VVAERRIPTTDEDVNEQKGEVDINIKNEDDNGKDDDGRAVKTQNYDRRSVDP